MSFHTLKLSITLLTATISTGCCMSQYANYVVANASYEPVTVEYKIPVGVPCPQTAFQLAALNDISKISKSTIYAESACNAELGSVRLTLPKGQAVSIFTAETTGCYGHRDPLMNALSVNGERGSISCSGDQIRSGFQWRNKDLYVLTYQ